MSAIMNGVDIGLSQQVLTVEDPAAQLALEEVYRAVHTLNSIIYNGGMINLPPYATADRPAASEGGLIFDTTLQKACIGTATGWQVITSV